MNNSVTTQRHTTRDPLRILMITARFLPDIGGIETHVHQVAGRLTRLGHTVTVLTTDRSAERRYVEVFDGINVVRAPAWPRKRDYYFSPAIYSEVTKGDWDVVHIQGCHTFVPVVAMLAAIRSRKKFVVSFHSGGHSSIFRNSIRGLQWRLLKPLFKRADHLIGVSRYEARRFSQVMGIPATRFSVVFNGAEMPKPSCGYKAKSKVIVSVGRLERYKGHQRLIRAMPYLLHRDPELQLRIVGDGVYKDYLERLAGQLGISDRVMIGGITPSNRIELASILGTASVVALLSDYEAHPIAVMEALACGAKVVVTNVSGLADLVEDGFVASVEVNDHPAVVADVLWSSIQSGGDCTSVQLPTWDSCVSALESIYLSVTNFRSGALHSFSPVVENDVNGGVVS